MFELAKLEPTLSCTSSCHRNSHCMDAEKLFMSCCCPAWGVEPTSLVYLKCCIRCGCIWTGGTIVSQDRHVFTNSGTFQYAIVCFFFSLSLSLSLSVFFFLSLSVFFFLSLSLSLLLFADTLRLASSYSTSHDNCRHDSPLRPLLFGAGSRRNPFHGAGCTGV